jgi:hypothetical protein
VTEAVTILLVRTGRALQLGNRPGLPQAPSLLINLNFVGHFARENRHSRNKLVECYVIIHNHLARNLIYRSHHSFLFSSEMKDIFA